MLAVTPQTQRAVFDCTTNSLALRNSEMADGSAILRVLVCIHIVLQPTISLQSGCITTVVFEYPGNLCQNLLQFSPILPSRVLEVPSERICVLQSWEWQQILSKKLLSYPVPNQFAPIRQRSASLIVNLQQTIRDTGNLILRKDVVLSHHSQLHTRLAQSVDVYL